MSQITQITYGKTVNIGNYQSIRVDFTADVEPGENPSDVLIGLKGHVRDAEITILRENPLPTKR